MRNIGFWRREKDLKETGVGRKNLREREERKTERQQSGGGFFRQKKIYREIVFETRERERE